MSRYLWSITPVLLISGSTLFAAPSSNATAPEAASPPTETHLDRRIADELERGQVSAAQADAKAAVQRYPDSAVLRRRHAQVQLCLAIQRGEQFREALDDAVWSQ